MDGKTTRSPDDLWALQIFSLMKLDCHPRFIRSTLYQQCVIAELENLPLPIDPPSPQAAAKNKRGAKKTKVGKTIQCRFVGLIFCAEEAAR